VNHRKTNCHKTRPSCIVFFPLQLSLQEEYFIYLPFSFTVGEKQVWDGQLNFGFIDCVQIFYTIID